MCVCVHVCLGVCERVQRGALRARACARHVRAHLQLDGSRGVLQQSHGLRVGHGVRRRSTDAHDPVARLRLVRGWRATLVNGVGSAPPFR